MSRQKTAEREDLEPLEIREELPQEYAGYAVCDPEGTRIGRAEEVFVNSGGEPEYIRVRMGLLRLKSALLPVQSVSMHRDRKTLVLQ